RGEMVMTHMASIGTVPDADLVADCDSTAYVLDVLTKHTGLKGDADYRTLLDKEELDAIVIATPSRFHAEMVQAALERDIHVYCEKPFCLDVAEGWRLVQLAEAKGLVSQVGYTFRFVAAFQEMS